MFDDDDLFGPDGDLARYLMQTPLPAVPDLDDPAVATTDFVGPPHLPSDLALQQAPMTTMPSTPAPAAMDVVDPHQAPLGIDAEQFQGQALSMDIQIQPSQMVAPAEQAFVGFPQPPVAVATRVGFDAVPWFDEGMFHGAPAGGIPSPYCDENDELAALFKGIDLVGNATGEPAMEVEPPNDVRPLEEDPLFVPFVPAQLDCTNCSTVRELLHESANHKLYLIFHASADHGTFHHAITDRTHIGADGQIRTNGQTMYLDLHQRSHSWVASFIANCVETLRNDSSGQLKDSWSTSGAAASSNISTTTFPAVNNAAHMELEFDMLKKILSTASTNDEAPHQGTIFTPQEIVENLQQGDGTFNNAASSQELNLPILDSYNNNQNVQDGGPSGAAEYRPSLLAVQRKRIANMSMADAMNLMHMTREDAAKLLNISSSSLKRLCRKNGDHHRWPARKINGLNKKIKKLEEAAARNGGVSGMLAIKEKMGKLILEKAQLYASTMQRIRENEMKNGASSSGTK